MDHELYRELIMEHSADPQNTGKLENPDRYGEEVNPTCGDEIHLYLKFKDGKLDEVAHDSKGCAISQASVSMFTELMKGKTEDELKKLQKEDVLELLGVPVGTMRLRCALLSLETLRNALNHNTTP